MLKKIEVRIRWFFSLDCHKVPSQCVETGNTPASTHLFP